MYNIDADTTTNRLYIDLNGRMDADESQIAVDETLEKAEQLRDGFDIINDLSGFKPPSPEAAKPIKRAQSGFKEMGVDRVIRVIDDETNNVVLNAFKRRSEAVGYSGESASSVKEAEQLLDSEDVDGYQ